MIRSFRHKGIQQFFETGSTAGIMPQHAKKLRMQLLALDSATHAGQMSAPGWELHPLHHNLEGHWAVSVSGSWRLTFTFDTSQDAILVDYQNYH